MTNKRIISWTALFLSVIFLSFLACEKMEKQYPTAVDTTSKNLTKTTTSLSSLLSATPDIIVNSTSDVVDFPGPMDVSALPGPDGLVTLREAITAANNTSGPQIIGFNIPTTDPGFDGKVFIIKPTTGLPVIEGESTTINGAIQTEFSGDSNPEGPEIVLNGSLLEPFCSGFTLRSSENNIHQLVINNFPGCGIVIEAYTAHNCVVTGCYIGVDRTGTSKVGNLHDGILLHGNDNQIGGYSTEERNIISGNGRDGIQIHVDGNSNLIVGNFIGTDISGTKSMGNDGYGIAINTPNCSYNRIIGNIILANGGAGIGMNSSNNQIGGYSDEEKNIISGNGYDGIKMINSNLNLIGGNFIGTDATGTKSEGNIENGIGGEGDNNRIISNVIFANGRDGIVINGSNNQIGGYSDEEKNIISENSGTGIGLQGNSNLIVGNFIGTDVSGTESAGNGFFGIYMGGSNNKALGNFIYTNGWDGIVINGSNNQIGGYSDAERNIISGNGRAGITMGENSNLNLIVGNFIGTDVTGTKSVGNNECGIGIGGENNRIVGNIIIENKLDGISIHGSNNQIGGYSDEERNIISGNGQGGINMGEKAKLNLIVGNFIGTDATGTKPMGNNERGIGLGGENNRIVGNVIIENMQDGIFIWGSNHQIGGYSAEERNIISGNGRAGIKLVNSNWNLIAGNFIGTDATGTKSVGNVECGIFVNGNNNRIVNNLISDNKWDGVMLEAADNNELKGNLIGTDINGNPTLGNAEFGVRIPPGEENSTGNRIGGKLINEGNTIAANGRGGILVGDAERPVNNNMIEGNTIHQNSNGGILVIFQSDGIKISQNSIYSNDGLGIDLDWNGITANDPGDGDTGTNNLMNFPVLTWAHAAPGQLVVHGEIDSPNPETVTIEFFANPVPTPGGDPSGYGEGAIFLGSKKPNPQGKFTATLSPVAIGTLITATATDANGNTSEFAANIAAIFP